MNDLTNVNSQNSKYWRMARASLIALTGLATLAALFCTEENWRGTRAWEQRKHQMEARGVALDWAAFIPPAVPDDQNFFKAPNMQEYFVGRGASNYLVKRLNGTLQWTKEPRLLVAEVAVSTAGSAGPEAINLDDAAARSKMKEALLAAVGPSILGPLNRTFLRGSVAQVKPVKLVVFSTNKVDLMRSFPGLIQGNPGRFDLESPRTNSFEIRVRGACSAKDYLSDTDGLESEWNGIREALKRPYARIEGDYSAPFSMPVVSFLTMRAAVQTLSSRARCHLLLGQPEEALQDLNLIHDLCRILECRPTGQPMTLVSAMINVAVQGLYTSTINDGIRLNAWRDEDLSVLEAKLKDINLLPQLARAFDAERAATSHALNVMSRAEMASIFTQNPHPGPLTRLGWACLPRGWIDMNRAIGSDLMTETLACFDLTNGLIRPEPVKAVGKKTKAMSAHGPTTFLVKVGLPNETKAISTCAFNQTLVNETRVACALERYRAAHGQYPDTLDKLAPTFAGTIPCDLINGKPLHYRRTTEGFQLYSVGWNETDDGGVEAPEQENGDWVWKVQP